MAALIGTTQQYYSEYERGIREIPLHSVIKLARFYHMSLDYTIEGVHAASEEERSWEKNK